MMRVYIKELSKAYRENIVLNNLNLTIENNTTYCLLGKNGAGKSTLLNIIVNIIEPSKGAVNIDGLNYQENELAIKKQMGIQSEFDQIVGELDAVDYLYWIGLLYDMDKVELLQRIEKILEYFFEDEDDLLKLTKNFSSGMRKKLSICAAVLHRPNLLILDEPFANLDPVASKKLCSFINAYKAPERVIIVSSHDLLYVDKIATHIGVLHNQELIFNGSLTDFKENGTASIDGELLKYLQPENQDHSLLNAIV
ncbi:ABC transporter ATP-binding protein [Arachidicoccus sp.]|uniref:ABC transporter ATP-binding protein n=1 Tax=Arachidicoccus sp. TaxID=1872624 RepID=UPI003D1CF8A3